MTVADKVALVTGAGSGMGRASSLLLAQQGAHVTVADINAETAQATRAAIEERGGHGLGIQADVGSLTDIDRMVQQTVETFGRLDIMVNNAGITKFLYVMDITEEDWDRIHRVNARGVFFCMQRAARQMIAQGHGGRIINIASIAGKGYTGTSNASYAASKAAVIGMTQIAAHQLARYDINVNAVCPGSTRTAMAQNSAKQRAAALGISEAEWDRRQAQQIPIGRRNEPEDIAAMVAFLATPGARNITGQAFNVDGGLVMH
ncbi:Diacetyl reductase [(S)-acetoin forming] [Candidatus Entotheonellaceae bacterium PAL068K]